MPNPSCLEGDDRADRLAFVHQVKRVVDLIQRYDMGDQIVDVDLTVHVPIDDLRNVGPATRTTERAALPHPARDKLERTGRNLGTRGRHADDGRDAPTLVAAL